MTLKTTVQNFIKFCNRHKYVVDIKTDSSDNVNVYYKGKDITLTKEGLVRFARVLNLVINFDDEIAEACVEIPEGNYEEMYNCECEVKLFFDATNMLVDEDLWQKWFTYTEDDESTKDMKTDGKMRISKLIEGLQEIQSKWGDIEVECDTLRDDDHYIPTQLEVNYYHDLETHEKTATLIISQNMNFNLPE